MEVWWKGKAGTSELSERAWWSLYMAKFGNKVKRNGWNWKQRGKPGPREGMVNRNTW